MKMKFEVQIQAFCGEWMRYGRYKFFENAAYYAKQYMGSRVVDLATGKVVR